MAKKRSNILLKYISPGVLMLVCYLTGVRFLPCYTVAISERRIFHGTKRAREHRLSTGPPGDPLAYPNAAYPRRTLATTLEPVCCQRLLCCVDASKQQVAGGACQARKVLVISV